MTNIAKSKHISLMFDFDIPRCLYDVRGDHDWKFDYQGWMLDDGSWLHQYVPECKRCGFRFYYQEPREKS